MLFFLFPPRIHGHMQVQAGSLQEWVLSQGCVCWDVCAHTPAGELHVQEHSPEGGGAAAGFTDLLCCLLGGLSVFELREQGVCRAVEFGHPPAKARAELVLPAGFKAEHRVFASCQTQSIHRLLVLTPISAFLLLILSLFPLSFPCT